jgi:lysophospholipase L1-like esterase
MASYPFHTTAAIATAALLLYGAHRLRPEVRLPDASLWTGLIDYTPERTPVSPRVLIRKPEEAAAPAPAPTAKIKIVRLLEDDGGALDHFYASLWRTERKEPGAITRIAHYGDSPTTGDLITGDVRELLQRRYGDAGRGFTLLAKPWAWYQRRYVEVSGSGWKIDPALHYGVRDGAFGYGGVAFGASGGARSRIQFSRPVDTVELWFERHPGGGRVDLAAGDEEAGSVDTAGDDGAPGYASIRLPAGARQVEIESTGGPVTLYGLALDRATPGVVYDCLGLNGGSITVLARIIGARNLTEQLRHRKPDLVVINYGTNESSFAAYIDKYYEKELREAIRRVRAALPQSSILVMSPMDRGERADGVIRTLPTIPRLVAIQRRVALDTGCGFFNTYEAMGGEGTMARWYDAQPRLVAADFIHPSPQGGRIVAEVLVKEIGQGLNRYKLRSLTQPARPPAPLTQTAHAVK